MAKNSSIPMEIKDGPVNLRTKVKVKGIEHKSKGKQKLIPGKVYDVHPITAKNLIESGHAVEA